MDNDDITITLSDINLPDIITIDTMSAMSSSTITMSDYSLSIDIDNNGDIIFTSDEWSTVVEFEDVMPDVSKIEDMCNNYPGLSKAYENFKTIYKMVHQDWVGRQKEDE